jgi:flagellar hook-associated protein 3 FlgL
MRVTFNTFPNGLIDQLSRLNTQQNGFQAETATGQRITNAEDDPASVRRVLDMQGETKTLDQYQRNISRHQELASASFTAIKQSKSLVDRAAEIATLADGTKSPETLKTLGIEVDSLLAQAVQLSNTKNRGDYIFGGTVPDKEPFTVTRDASGSITGVSYGGNTELPSSEISEKVLLSSQTIGANSTGSGGRGLFVDSASGADIFQHLISLRDNLNSGNAAAINKTDLANLQKDENSFLFHIGTNGVVQSRLEATTAIVKQRSDSLTKLVSKEADADLADTLVKLNQTQTAYKAALQSGGKILSQSLLDYLR